MNTNLINFDLAVSLPETSGVSSPTHNLSNEEKFEQVFQNAQSTTANRPKQTTNHGSSHASETEPAFNNATGNETNQNFSSTANNEKGKQIVSTSINEGNLEEVNGSQISGNPVLSGNELSLLNLKENLENQGGLNAEEILKLTAASQTSQLTGSGNALNGGETLLTSGNPEKAGIGNLQVNPTVNPTGNPTGNPTANAMASVLNPGNPEIAKRAEDPLVQLLKTEEIALVPGKNGLTEESLAQFLKTGENPLAQGKSGLTEESLVQFLKTEENPLVQGKNGLVKEPTGQFFKTGETPLAQGTNGLMQSSAVENPSGKEISPLEVSKAKGLTENPVLPGFQEVKGLEKPNSGLTTAGQISNNENLSRGGNLNAGFENTGEKVGATAVRVNDDLPITGKATNKPAPAVSQKTQSQSAVLETNHAVRETDPGKNHNFSMLQKPLEQVFTKDTVQPAKVAEGNQQALNQSALNAFKPLGAATPTLDLGTANVEFQSLVSQENQLSTGSVKPQASDSLNTSSALNAARMVDFNQTKPLEKMIANVEIKPQEVFERSVVDQVVSKASLISRNGQSEMHIQLDPPSLGTVKVQVTMMGDKVSVNLMADHSIAKEIIERNIQHLRNSFAEQGFKVEEMSVNVGNDPRQQAADQQRPFFMGNGFKRMDPSEMENNANAIPVAAAGIEHGYSESGGISLFV